MWPETKDGKTGSRSIYIYLQRVVVPEVSDIVAAPSPPDQRRVGFGSGIHQRSHALVVQAVRLDEVHDGESAWKSINFRVSKRNYIADRFYVVVVL